MKTYNLFSSAGNDSIATAQLLVEMGLPMTDRVRVVYSNTGWAAPYWLDRVLTFFSWAEKWGIEPVILGSKGFEALVREEGNRKGEPPGRFPSGLAKFCTRHLKILPSKKWLDEVDPGRTDICVTGVRREESQRRASTPIWMPDSENHGGRLRWNPLAEHKEDERNALIRRAGFDVLPHRSDECEPCIFSSRADLRRVRPEKVDIIRQMEKDTGKTMFRPKAYAGANGIDEVMRWAWSEPGKFKPAEELPPLPSQVQAVYNKYGITPSLPEDGEEDGDKACDGDFCGI